VFRTIVTVFNDTLNLNRPSLWQQLEFKSQRHTRVNSAWFFLESYRQFVFW